MKENRVYFLAKKRPDGRLQSAIDDENGQPYQFKGKMLPDRLARALRADGFPYFVVACDLSCEEPHILPRYAV